VDLLTLRVDILTSVLTKQEGQFSTEYSEVKPVSSTPSSKCYPKFGET